MSELSEDAEVSNTSRLSMDRGNDGSSNDPITRIEIGSYTTADNSHLLVESGLRLWKPLRETLFTGRACARLDSAWLGTRGTARGDKHFHCRNISNLSDDTHAEDPLAPAGPPRAGWFLETLNPYFAYRFAFGSSIYECVSYAATVYRGHARAHT